MTTLREASFKLPRNLPDGTAIPETFFEACLRECCETWGGATMREAEGIWVGEKGTVCREPVREIEIAMPDTDQDADALLRLALRYARQSEQEAVYVRFANGNVDIVDTGNPARE